MQMKVFGNLQFRTRKLSRIDCLRIGAGEALLIASLIALCLTGEWVYIGTPHVYCQATYPDQCGYAGPTHVSTAIFSGLQISPLIVAACFPFVSLADPRLRNRLLGCASVVTVVAIAMVRVYTPPLTYDVAYGTFTTPTMSLGAIVSPMAAIVAGILIVSVLVSGVSRRSRTSVRGPSLRHSGS